MSNNALSKSGGINQYEQRRPSGDRFSLSVQDEDFARGQGGQRKQPRGSNSFAAQPPVEPRSSTVPLGEMIMPFQAVAVHAFTQSISGMSMLKLSKGDRITVLQKKPKGWALGRSSSGREGIFPLAYVKRDSSMITSKKHPTPLALTRSASNKQVNYDDDVDSNVDASSSQSGSYKHIVFNVLACLAGIVAMASGSYWMYLNQTTNKQLYVGGYVVLAGFFVLVNELGQSTPIVQGKFVCAFVYVVMAAPMCLNLYTRPAAVMMVLLAVMLLMGSRPNRSSDGDDDDDYDDESDFDL